MKIESTAFETADLLSFLGELRDRERLVLLERLERAAAGVQALRPQLTSATPEAGGEDWTAHEVLAHMSVLSKFYGVIAYRVGTAKFTEFDFLSQVRLRDVAGEAASAQPAGELLDAMATDHARSAEFLRTVDPNDLYRRADTGIEGLQLSAMEVLMLPLVTHLEAHLEQLQAALG